MKLRPLVQSLRAYPSAMLGSAIVISLFLVAVYSLVRYPYSEVVRLWRAGEELWAENPRNAGPVWLNLFGGNRPLTIKLSWEEAKKIRSSSPWEGVEQTTAVFSFSFPYDSFPTEVAFFLTPMYKQIPPLVQFIWQTPDGQEFALGERMVRQSERYVVSADPSLSRRFGGKPLEVVLFGGPQAPERPQKGTYKVVLEVYTFEPQSSLEAKCVVYGQLYGWAGTDHLRRDLGLALLWGTPVALAFGFTAALVIFSYQVFISAVAAWWGGIVDLVVERLTELRMIVPMVPVLALIGVLWSRSLWTMLAALIVYHLLGGQKVYRATFLSVRTAPYVEAARAYGASNLRIVVRYLIPRVVPALLPSFIVGIPGYVFLEASLALLGLGDPRLPTWGKIIHDAYTQGALYRGQYYWVLEPVSLLVLTGLGFTLLGSALDRLLNPRLRRG